MLRGISLNKTDTSAYEYIHAKLGTIPSFMVITDAKRHEVKVTQDLFFTGILGQHNCDRQGLCRFPMAVYPESTRDILCNHGRMIYYLLLAYIKYQTQYKHSVLYLTRIMKECLFNRVDIIDLLNLILKKVQHLRDPCCEMTLF